jgi:hypothetical protein
LTAGLALAAPREIEIPETLRPGDQYELLLRSSQVRFGQSAGVQQAVSTAHVTLEVGEGQDGYRVVTWTYRNIGFQGGGPARPILERIARLAEGQRIEYYLNGEGAVVGVRNMEELLQFNRVAIDELLAVMSEQPGGEQAVDLTRRMTEPLLSAVVVESQSLKVPQPDPAHDRAFAVRGGRRVAELEGAAALPFLLGPHPGAGGDLQLRGRSAHTGRGRHPQHR